MHLHSCKIVEVFLGAGGLGRGGVIIVGVLRRGGGKGRGQGWGAGWAVVKVRATPGNPASYI